MDLDQISQAIGSLQATQRAMQGDLQKMQVAVSDMQITLSEARGGWKTLLLVGGAAGAFGALVGKIVPWWPK